ncbi:sulfate transporter family-domain-containing protein [Gorgonomyces haynaldii]|nr:sulfate transporter family-domain-containing protein [Gorgonomyces haynaldii]
MTIEIDSAQVVRKGSLVNLEVHLPADEIGYRDSQKRWQRIYKDISWSSLFPVIKQLQHYSKDSLYGDLKAGVSIAFVLLPQAVAYASLAGVTPRRALMTAVWPLFIYAILGASRCLSVGPEAVTSVLVGVAVSREVALYGGDPNEIAAVMAIIVGIGCLLLSVLDAGFIDSVFSGHLLTGFVTGAATLIMVEQMSELFGIRATKIVKDASTFQKLTEIFDKENGFHWPTLVFGLSCLGFLFAFKYIKHRFDNIHWLKAVPPVLILVVICIVASVTMNLEQYGMHILKDVPSGIVPPAVPALTLDRINHLLPDVITIIIAGFVESQAFTRQIAAKSFPSGDRELFALGAANAFGSFFGCYPSFGSLARSTIQRNAGGMSNLAGVIAAALVLVLFLAASSVLKFLPKATLAAIVFNAAVDLIEYDRIIFLFKRHNFGEVFFFLACYCLTFFLPIGQGIIFILLLAAFLILRKSTMLNMELEGEICYIADGKLSKKYVDVKYHPEATMKNRLLLLAIKGPLEFYNASRLRRRIELFLEIERKLLQNHESKAEPNAFSERLFVNAKEGLKSGYCVIMDFRMCENLDGTGLFVLHELMHLFKERQVTFLMADIPGAFLPKMEQSGLLEMQQGRTFATMSEAVEYFESLE